MDGEQEAGQRLGSHLRNLRESRDLSIRGLAATARVDFGWLSRLERGLIASPDPRSLYRLARALDVEAAELYQEAGYGEGLPGLSTYLRSKYDLPDEAVSQLEAHFELINERYRREKGGGE